MARFFFNFRQGNRFSQDVTGIELATTEEAYLAAHRTAQDMWSELLRDRHDPRRCAFEVRDSCGELLFVLPFEEVIESCCDCVTVNGKAGIGVASDAARAKRLSLEFLGEIIRLRDNLRLSSELLSIPVPELKE